MSLPRCPTWFALTLALLAAARAPAADAWARVVWPQGEPHAEVNVQLDAVPAGLKEVIVPLDVTGRSGRRLWGADAKVALKPDATGQALVKLDRLPADDAPYRLSLRAARADLGLAVAEQHSFAGPREAVLSYGLRRTGRFPTDAITLVLGLGGIGDEFVTAVDLEATVRDREQNVVLKRNERVAVGRQPARYLLPVTPPRDSVGPYVLDYRITSDLSNLSFQQREPFAYATTLLPLSSMESDELLDWYRSSFASPRNFSAYSLTFNSNDLIEPAVFDATAPHSGSRAVRVDYVKGQAANLYSDLVLPGYPVRARVWVKGNGSPDKLIAVFRDRCEVARWQHERHVNRSEALVCTLDFTDWREFTVPVIGGGLPASSRHENQKGIAVPIYLLGFIVQPADKKDDPGDAATPRQVWLDDFAVETQLPVRDRLALEVLADTPDARLHAQAVLTVTVGNGTAQALPAGRLAIAARDRTGKAVFELAETLAVPADGFAQQAVPLARLAAAQPVGPVDVDITFTAPATGARATRRLVFKASQHAALLWDFEDAQPWNGFGGGAGGQAAAGGAAGSRQALKLAVPPKTGNGVVLHPALPGVADRVELLVKGGPVPVLLRPYFLDAGITGVAGMAYNKFPLPELRVDWPDWRPITLVCPAVPAGYAEADRMFVFQPAYPLNLALTAQVVGEQAGELWVDRVRVLTHLPPAAEVTVAVAWPDDTRVLKPGAPLALQLTNCTAGKRTCPFAWELRGARGETVATAKAQPELPPGVPATQVLLPALAAGVYELSVTGFGPAPFTESIVAMDLVRYFGADPRAALTDLRGLEAGLGMTLRKVHLDWDNMELVPNLFHYDWFNAEITKAAATGTVVPVVGFAADWAGPEKQASVADGTYSRFIGNYLQTPVRQRDWEVFTREAVREYHGRFAAWQFWENADLAGSPAYIPPERYRELLGALQRWVRLYDPKTPVIAGGFNFDRVFTYLSQVPEPATLPFDRIGVEMNLGELSPEAADLEGFVDDLSDLLKLAETGRSLEVPQLDWQVGEHVSAIAQGAFHARASLIFHRRGAAPHRIALVNLGESFAGYGLFYRAPWGNSPNVQDRRPVYSPKPSYFALTQTRAFLAKAKFVTSVRVPDADALANRAYVYDCGDRTGLALWRPGRGARAYRVPAAWRGATATDAFGSPVALADEVLLTGVPLFLLLPPAGPRDQLVHDLRTLAPADGRDRVVLALAVAEPDSARRAAYAATGQPKPTPRRGRLCGGVPVNAVFVDGLASERFEFTAADAGTFLLTRTWYCDGVTGQKLTVQLNDGAEQPWDLSLPTAEAARRLYPPGVRESGFILSGAVPGKNTVSVRYAAPGNCAAYRVAPLAGPAVDLVGWGPLTAVQAKGEALLFASAIGTPLKLGQTTHATGIGTHAVAHLEFPLNGQFARFTATVGVDAATSGKGSMVCKVYVDGVEQATSGPLTGFSPPRELRVDGLEAATRLTLRVEDGGDGNANDLADWVAAQLWLKPPPAPPAPRPTPAGAKP